MGAKKGNCLVAMSTSERAGKQDGTPEKSTLRDREWSGECDQFENVQKKSKHHQTPENYQCPAGGSAK